MRLIKGKEIEGKMVTYELPNGGTIEHEYHVPVIPLLTDMQSAKVAQIKAEAAQRIRALDWKVERAKERDALNTSNTLESVLLEREAIRVASNEAEKAVNALATTNEVEKFTW